MISGVVMVGLLVAPLTATADDATGKRHDVEGRILGLPGTYIGFDLKGKKKLKNFAITIPFACFEIPIGQIAPIPAKKVSTKVNAQTGAFKVKYRQNVEGTKVRVTIAGKATGKKYKGTVEMVVVGGGIGHCTSGVADFSAKKGKRVISPPALVSAPRATVPGIEGWGS